MTLSNTRQTTCVTLASCGQLQAREENWRVLAEMLPQLVWTTRADGWVDYTNQRFCDYTHATPEQLQGYGWGQFLHPEDAELALAVRAHAFRRGIPYEVEYRLREGQTGCYRWFLVRGTPCARARNACAPSSTPILSGLFLLM
jgi:PAS domain S-box-containing protein